MGKWVILIGDEDFGLDTVRRMAFAGKTGVRNDCEKQFDVVFEEGSVSFQEDCHGQIAGEYAPEELKSLPFDTPRFLLMRYSAGELLERVVRANDFPSGVLVDCDGLDLGLERFIEKTRLLNSCEENRAL